VLGGARKQSNRDLNGFGAASKAAIPRNRDLSGFGAASKAANFITEVHLENSLAAACECLVAESLPPYARVRGFEVHRCLCIIDAGNGFISTVMGSGVNSCQTRGGKSFGVNSCRARTRKSSDPVSCRTRSGLKGKEKTAFPAFDDAAP
jgi:hypothetical protein